MDEQPGQPTQSGQYGVYLIDPRDPSHLQLGSFHSLSNALKELKALRDNGPDSGAFIVPANATERDEFPYRNRIGPVRDDNSNQWGYQYREPGTDVVVAMILAKAQLGPHPGPPVPSLKEELESEEMEDEVTNMEIHHKVRSHVQIALEDAGGGRCNEERKDFVFDGEADAAEESGGMSSVDEDEEEEDNNDRSGQSMDQ